MAKIAPFLGYQSKVDATTNDGRIATDCNNIIFYKNDIYNYPYPSKRYNGIGFSPNGNLLGIYKRTDAKDTYLISLEDNKLWVSSIINRSSIFNFIQLQNNLLPISGWEWLEDFAINGNIIQVGDWAYILTQTVDSLKQFDFPRGTIFDPLVEDVITRAYMIKLKIYEHPQTQQLKLQLFPIGIYQPQGVNRFTVGDGNGNINGQWDFGFSFVYRNILTDDEIESNVTIYNNLTSYTFRKLSWDIFLPIEHSKLFIGNSIITEVNVYARNQNQSIYYHVGKLDNVSQPVFDGNGLWRVRGLFDPSADLLELQDITKPAPLTGVIPIIGAHDVPRQANHGCFFKGRMYYNCIGTNLLQVSARTPVGEPETGKYASYIEFLEPVGKEHEEITGIIEYAGQLFIFKENDTFVLTDSIEIGSFVNIFPGVGAVGKEGGKAYIVAEDTLCWGSRAGIYGYNGSLAVISGDISEDLEQIDRNNYYNFMRLGYDPRYKLLKVHFPARAGYVETNVRPPTFYYNVKDNLWSKGDPSRSSIIDENATDDPTQQYNVIDNTYNGFDILNLIERDGIASRNWFWLSSLIDEGDLNIPKLWQDLSIEMVPILSDLLLPITVTYYDEQDNVLKSDTRRDTKLRAIDVNGYGLKMQFNGLTKKAFRIHKLKTSFLGRGLR